MDGRRIQRGGRRRPPPRARSTALVVVGLAVAVGLAGLVTLLWLVAPPPAAAAAQPGRIAAGGLSLEIQDTSWVTHDDVGGPVPTSVADGFQMPASMMPGMPAHGIHRLYLEAVLSDVGQDDGSFAPREFGLRSSTGSTWTVNEPASFSPGTLHPGQQRLLDLFFDIPDTVSDVALTWVHDGLSQSVPIDERPPAPHEH